MLNEVIKRLESSREPVTLRELSRDLKIDPEALRGMLEYLDRKGKVAFRCEDCGTTSVSSCKDCSHGCIIGKA